MLRSTLAVLGVSLLAALPAAAQRQSLGTLALEQTRITSAICAKADADGDSYRPFVCTPRCGCLAELLASQAPQSCEATGPGAFSIEFPAPAGSCSSAGFCAESSFAGCGASLCLTPGEVCVSSSFGSITIRTCQRPCSSDAGCSGTSATLTGVAGPDSPDASVCTVGTAAPQNINSNDARLCVSQVEASTGPCQ